MIRVRHLVVSIAAAMSILACEATDRTQVRPSAPLPSSEPSRTPPSRQPSPEPPSSSPPPTTPPSPSATAASDDCGATLRSVVDAAPLGAVLDLRSCVYTAGATIDKPLTIRGARLELPTRDPSARYTHEIVIESSDVTLEDLTVVGGANTISIEGPYERTVIRGADIRGQIGSAVWIKGAANGTIIEDSTFITDPGFHPPSEPGVSPIRVEGCAGAWPCTPLTVGTVIRGNVIDQGPYFGNDGPGWFGIELIRAPDSLIEGNTVKGGHTMISIPNSDGTVIRSNDLDLRGGATWGIEVAGSLDVVISDNLIDGGRRRGKPQAGISWNATSGRMPTGSLVTGNTIRNVDTAFQVSGDGHDISGNCLGSLGSVYYEYGGTIGPNVRISDNAACPTPGTN